MYKIDLLELPEVYKIKSHEEFLQEEIKLYIELCEKVEIILIESPVRDICIRCSTIKSFNNSPELGCCSGCKYLGEKGCTTNSLICKLWLCSPKLRSKLTEEQTIQLSIIRKIAEDHSFLLGARMGINEIISNIERTIENEELETKKAIREFLVEKQEE